MGDREEDERLLKLLTEALEQPEKSPLEAMKEVISAVCEGDVHFSRTIYATAGVCYLCCDDMPEPTSEKDLTLSDVVCDGCKNSGFWK